MKAGEEGALERETEGEMQPRKEERRTHEEERGEEVGAGRRRRGSFRDSTPACALPALKRTEAPSRPPAVPLEHPVPHYGSHSAKEWPRPWGVRRAGLPWIWGSSPQPPLT